MKTRWQDQAACKGRDVDLFHPYDQEDFPDLAGQTIATFSKAKLEYAARQYCSGCPVTKECEDDAIAYGHHNQGLYGGTSPYDRGLKVGAIVGAVTDIHMDARNESAIRAWLAGCDVFEIRRRGGLEPNSERLPKAVTAYAASFREEGVNARWGAYSIPTVASGRAVSHQADEGWVLSVDYTRSTLLVLTAGKRRWRVWHPIRMVTLSDDLDIGELPLMEYWPEAYDCI